MADSAYPPATLRPASLADAARLLDIYAPYVETTAITIETEVPSCAEFTARMEEIMGTYPYLVAEIGDDIVGYAYVHRCGEKAGYRWNVELTVYLDRSRRARGLGRLLCDALLGILEAQGAKNIFSLISIPNDASFRLHEALGFKRIGIQEHAGYKLGAWHDIAWLQKSIGSFSGEPRPFIAFTDLDPAVVEDVFRTARAAAEERTAAKAAATASTEAPQPVPADEHVR